MAVGGAGGPDGRRRRGHAARPHTADACIEAWAGTPAECYEEAVAAFVEIFADPAGAPAGSPRPFRLGPADPAQLLALLLEEVLFVLEVDGLVAVGARVDPESGGPQSFEPEGTPAGERPAEPTGELSGELHLVPIEAVQVAGSPAKGISYGDLVFARTDEGWYCRATVDV